MPLIIKETTHCTAETALDVIFNSECFKESSKKLHEQKVEAVSNIGLLYVNQREFAVTTPSDEFIQVLGTQDATTCHTIVIRNQDSGVTAIAHCDGLDTENALSAIVTRVGLQPGQLDVHLVGGFVDDRQESMQLSRSIISILVKQQRSLHLQTACITDLNDTIKDGVHFPVIYGIGVNVASGDIFPAIFTDDSPELDVRSASHFVGFNKMLNVYKEGSGVLTVGPFTWQPWEDVALWCELPDHIIRKHLSTSPAQEPQHFVRHVRAALAVIRDHQQPEQTLFPDNQPHLYKIQPDGHWERISN